MNITAKEFTIEMSQNELWSTAFDVRNALYYTLKGHWVNHQDAWQNNENERLGRLKVLYYSLGRPDLYDDVFVKAKEVFDEYNKSRT